jgi:UDP-glucuronate decarboxylase
MSYSSWGHVNPIGPRACYDEGKRVAETLTYGFQRQDGVDVRVARIFNTYGPRSKSLRKYSSTETTLNMV